jgi:hypothetical protein
MSGEQSPFNLIYLTPYPRTATAIKIETLLQRRRCDSAPLRAATLYQRLPFKFELFLTTQCSHSSALAKSRPEILPSKSVAFTGYPFTGI